MQVCLRGKAMVPIVIVVAGIDRDHQRPIFLFAPNKTVGIGFDHFYTDRYHYLTCHRCLLLLIICSILLSDDMVTIFPHIVHSFIS
jgi:hypothetical protein